MASPRDPKQPLRCQSPQGSPVQSLPYRLAGGGKAPSSISVDTCPFLVSALLWEGAAAVGDGKHTHTAGPSAHTQGLGGCPPTLLQI
jgi:hypothetical protein